MPLRIVFTISEFLLTKSSGYLLTIFFKLLKPVDELCDDDIAFLVQVVEYETRECEESNK